MLLTHTVYNRIIFFLLMIGLTSCQLLTPKSKTAEWMLANQPACTTQSTINNTCPPSFEIQGKIGLRSSVKTGSAFYTWIQYGHHYDIVLSGILGIGQTHIWGDNHQANIENHEQLQNAANPEELLYHLTGWRAPLNLLPFWMNGLPSPTQHDDAMIERDIQQRLTKLSEQNWHIQFFYADSQLRPNRLILETMEHPASKTTGKTYIADESIRLIVTIKPIGD